MAIKFGMSVADMIMQLTKGFMKATGRKPEALEKIKIQQEAVQRFRDQRKVVDMEGNIIDTSKGIMGGTQIGQRGMFDNIFNRMQRDMGKGKPKEVKNKKPDPEKKAFGGRIGYKLGSIDKARRAFLKTAAGVGGGIAALKTGLLGLSKQAGPAVEAVKETVTQAPSYFFDLVAKIKMFGKPGISIGPRQNTMNYKNYELMEDVSTGDIRITKQKGDPDFGYEEEVMEYRKGQRTEDGMIPDEYEEATIRPDMDGKMKDIEDGIEPDSIQEIIKEVTDEAPSIKKADGGRIGYKNGLGVLSLGDRGFIKKPKKKVIVIDGVEYEIPLDKGFNRIPEPNPDAVPPVPMPTYPKNKKAGGGIARMLGE